MKKNNNRYIIEITLTDCFLSERNAIKMIQLIKQHVVHSHPSVHVGNGYEIFGEELVEFDMTIVSFYANGTRDSVIETGKLISEYLETLFDINPECIELSITHVNDVDFYSREEI